ncbi:MAG: DUF1570 domain-containing protein [Planctomycetes bacterium]|nr:DUF1570 domain-containing protein [Planctomycetota bacterium]
MRRTGLVQIGYAAALVAILGVTGCATIEPAPGTDADAVSAGALPAELPPAMDIHTGEVPVTRESWNFSSYPGTRLSTPNYAIHTTIKYERFLARLPVFVECSLDRYRTALADLPRPRRRLQTYIFRDRRQWSAKTRQLLPDQASTFENLGRGGYTTRGTSVLYYIDWSGRDRDTFAITAHEGWHQYTQTCFRNPLPIWLEEGIATYMEGYRFRRDMVVPDFQPWNNWERSRALGDAIRAKNLIPLRELLDESPQKFLSEGKERLLVYYAQAWALTRFLADGDDGRYRDELAEVLSDAAAGRMIPRLARAPAVLAYGGKSRVTSRTGPWVILGYFTSDLVAFEQQYLAYARSIAR